MANLVFLPVEDQLKSGTYLLYDDACGTGGMLTVAEETLTAIGNKRGLEVKCGLYGQEINPETYAICKADMLIKGRARTPTTSSAVPSGPRWRTTPSRARNSTSCSPTRPTARAGRRTWRRWAARTACATRASRSCTKARSCRWSPAPATARCSSSVNMASKMNHSSALGSRIAEVHNGSSLFTGDAGQGESNIRRWLIENDWLEAIVALPLNLFYNTGIATYIWVLSNRKPAHRKGRVQLIDASQWFKPLRKNLGKKNCELGPDDIERISRTFLDFKETPESKIFPNAAFGYWKVTSSARCACTASLSLKAIETLRFASGDEDLRAALYEEFGDDLFNHFDRHRRRAGQAPGRLGRRRRRADEDEEGGAPKKGLPEKKRKKLLDPKTWERDGRLVEVATACAKRWATASSKTTTSSATASTPR
jgi:type I restriction enzyme M protein